MVSFNVYRSTTSGFYVEGVCLATDEKPVVGIANGSILFAVDTESGETTRYMYDQNSMSWIEAECPCGGGSGSGGGSGGDVVIHEATITGMDEKTGPEMELDVSYNDIVAEVAAGKLVAYTAAGTGEIDGEQIDFVQGGVLEWADHNTSTGAVTVKFGCRDYFYAASPTEKLTNTVPGEDSNRGEPQEN